MFKWTDNPNYRSNLITRISFKKPFIWAKSGICQICLSHSRSYLLGNSREKQWKQSVVWPTITIFFHENFKFWYHNNSTCPVFAPCVCSFTAVTHMVLPWAANCIWIRQTSMSFWVSHGTINVSWLCNMLECLTGVMMLKCPAPHYLLWTSEVLPTKTLFLPTGCLAILSHPGNKFAVIPAALRDDNPITKQF